MHRGGFTWVHMLVLGVVLLGLGAVVLPAIQRPRRVVCHLLNNATQARNIHQQMVTFARSNKAYYPGLDSTGQVVPVASIAGGNQLQGGADPGSRFAILIARDLLDPGQVISPLEPRKQAWDGQSDMTEANYSYALLALDKPGRVGEWHDTLNSDAVVVSDRAIRNGTGIRSIQASPSLNASDWQGALVYNDNRTVFETTSVISQPTTGNTTRYSTGGWGKNQTFGPTNPRDDLFADDNTGGFDALMVYEDSRDAIHD